MNVTSASATAFAVGLAGATNPAFQVDASTALQAAGLKLTGAIAAGTVTLAVISSGADASLTLNAKGTGDLTLMGSGTGVLKSGRYLQFTSNVNAPAATGIIGREATNGFYILAPTGATNDFVLLSGAGTTIAVVPTGTSRLKITDIQLGTALVALGGGAAPTVGTIGGSGPAAAAQNSWAKLVDSTGASCWVPVWK